MGKSVLIKHYFLREKPSHKPKMHYWSDLTNIDEKTLSKYEKMSA